MARQGATPPPRPIDWRVAIALGLCFLLWGSAFPAIRFAGRHLTPPHLALLRFLSASAALALAALATRMPLPRRADLPRFLAVGILGVPCYHLLLNFGLSTVSAGVGSLLVNTAPVFTALLARRILREAVSPAGWIGFALAVAGAAIIAAGEGHGFHLAPGVALLLGAAFSWALNIVLQKPLLARYSAFQATCVTVWIGTAFLLACAPGFPAALAVAHRGALLTVVYLGVIPIGVASTLWAYGLSRMQASRIVGLTYLIPLVAATIAWVWQREAPAPVSVVGAGVVLVGVALVVGRR